jgi:hypothetical protein
VSGTFSGGGTFTQDQAAKTYTTNGNLIMKPTNGPSQYFPLFDVSLAGPSTWAYSVDETALTVAQSINGATTIISLTRK